mgnify:CR=1 FL=1
MLVIDGQRAQGAIVASSQEELCGKRSHEGQEQVPLCIPLISLGAEECIGGFPSREGHSPFEEFVTSAECQADRGDQPECSRPRL